MKFSVIALGLMLAAGTALAQGPDNPGSKAGKTASGSGQTNTQGTNSAGTEKTGNPSDVKTQTFKGTLVNASCGGSATGAAASGQPSASRNKAQAAGATGKSEATKGEASRSANAGSSCSISSSSNEFALQTKDGQTLHFDAVGNERVKQELLNRKNWANASAAGKPIQATVNGTQTGDSLMVLSIN